MKVFLLGAVACVFLTACPPGDPTPGEIGDCEWNCYHNGGIDGPSPFDCAQRCSRRCCEDE
jgi:hypothetical protein